MHLYFVLVVQFYVILMEYVVAGELVYEMDYCIQAQAYYYPIYEHYWLCVIAVVAYYSKQNKPGQYIAQPLLDNLDLDIVLLIGIPMAGNNQKHIIA